MTRGSAQDLFRDNLVRSAILLAVAIAVVCACRFMAPIGASQEAGVSLQLPSELPGYTVQEGEISEGERTVLPPDTGFARKIYTSSTGDYLVASIILSGAERRSIHRPEVCLPAQGWGITQSKITRVKMKDGTVLPVMRLRVARHVRLPNGQNKELVSYIYYCFIGKDVVTASHWMRVWITSFDRVFHRTNHRWAYLLVQELVTEGLKLGGLSEEQTMLHMENAIREITPTFLRVKLPPE